jgi:lysophospholipase L1-like esterase
VELHLQYDRQARSVALRSQRLVQSPARQPRLDATKPGNLLIQVEDGSGVPLRQIAVADPTLWRADWTAADGLHGGSLRRDTGDIVVALPADPQAAVVKLFQPRDLAAAGTMDLVGSVALPATPVSAPAGGWAVAPIVNSGDPANRIDVVFVGDGYQAGELGRYAAHVQEAVTTLFGDPLLAEYQRYFNVHRIDVISRDSGADHPESGSAADTALGATFNCAGAALALCADDAAVFAAAASAPAPADLVIVLVNDPAAAGGSGAYVVATGASVSGLLLHQLGHALGRLADEYVTESTDPADLHAPNVSPLAARADIPWTAWINAATSLPTTDQLPGIPGLYAGALSGNDLYRPTWASAMRQVGAPLDPVNTQQLLLSLYERVSPIDEAQPADPSVSVAAGSDQVFSVRPVQPATHALEVRWFLNDTPAQQGGEVFRLSTAGLAAGTHRVHAEVTDATPLVRRDPDRLLVDTRTWTVDIAAPAAPLTGFMATQAAGDSGFSTLALAGDYFVESGGQVVMEAENFDASTPRDGHDWTVQTNQSGFSGAGFVQCTPNDGSAWSSGFVTTSPEISFDVNFATTGTYYVWTRGSAANGNDDSAHAGLDGTGPASADNLDGYSTGWTWSRNTRDGAPATIVVSTAGVHTIHLWGREDGLKIDKVLLRTSSSSTAPSGTGPAESPRGPGGGDTTPPVISSVNETGITANAATVTWNTDEPATSRVEYGTTTGYGQSTPLDSTLVTGHSVPLTGLAADTTYHYRVHSLDGSGNPAQSGDNTFTTDPSTGLQPFQESGGQVVMEAENFDAVIPRSGHDWSLRSSQSGFAGSGYMEATPNDGTGITSNYTTTSPEISFSVNFVTTGTYYIWIRGAAPSGADDSLHAGLDGTGPASADKITGFTTGWVWKRTTMDASAPATISVSSAGVHTFHLWMREDGLKVDRVLLRRNSSSTAPSGSGPAESPRGGGGGGDPPTISNIRETDIALNRAAISWRTDENATSQVEYGTTTAYGQTTPVDSALVKRHVQFLTGLTPGTLYHYRVLSEDGSGDLATSSDQTFTTASSHDVEEFNGQVVFEAEHEDAKTPRGGKDWSRRTSVSGFSGAGYLEVLPNTGTTITSGYVTTSAEAEYNVDFTTPGTYYVWTRGSAANGNDDSLHAGINNTGPSSADHLDGFGSGWTWSRNTKDGAPATITVPSTGNHTVHIWMREDGFRADKILLRTSSSSTPPAAAGPSESGGQPRTMALGDSVTQGVGDSDVFGYRDHLDFLLGVGEAEFVGGRQHPSSNKFYDVDHEGVPGNLASQVEARIAAALDAHMPAPNPADSRVLLHIGINDMQDRLPIGSVVDNVEDIVDLIDAHDPAINVYVALITPSTIAADDAVFTSYNNALQTRIQSMQGSKSNLFLVDMNAAFKQNPSWATAYMDDEVHPNDAGYQVMADVWAQGIAANE